MIRIVTLGRLRVDAGGEDDACPLLRRRKCFALLVYLATPHRAFHSRERLASTFWPRADREHARNSLRQSLHLLRSELGGDILSRRGRELVGVDRDRLVSDAHLFMTALRRGRPEAALRLYRGDFLEGFSLRGAPEFDRWSDGVRSSLRDAATSAARRLALEARREARRDDALRWWRRAETIAPYSEAVALESILELIHSGELSRASDRYERFARRRARDLGFPVSPDAKRRIEDALRARAWTRRAERPRPARTPAPPSGEGAGAGPSI